MTFKLPPLPYGHDALAPVISAETLRLHHGAHHQTYVDKLNELLHGKEMAERSLAEVVKWSAAAESRRSIFNNAGQAWNHGFYWQSLRPAGYFPGNALGAEIRKAFGGLDALKKELIEAGSTHFGSGWVWLVCDQGHLKVVTTHDAGTPLASREQRPLLAIDVWEHAYYVDYRNKRAEHLEALVDKLLNWEFAEANLIMAHEPRATV